MTYDERTRRRFWLKAAMIVDDPRGCWLWTGARNPNGRPSRRRSGASEYGRFKVGGRARAAHHVAWEMAHGRAFPRGAVCRHTCNTAMCVRPSHLRASTHARNMADLRRSGRRRRNGRKG